MIPLLLDRGIHVQIVTGAFRPIAPVWATLAHMNVVVSIDGLQPEHDARNAPETYDRILKKIAGQKITIHCTVTGQMMKRPGYLKEFLEYWTPRAEIQKVWFSLFTPQVGDRLPEMLQPHDCLQAIADMLALRKEFPKLDMPEGMIRRFATPPRSPRHCVFALTTQTLSADLKAKIVPCQFGGNPDCGSCGCIASMGLAAGAAHRLGGIIRKEPSSKPPSGLVRLARLGPNRWESWQSRKHCGCCLKNEDWRNVRGRICQRPTSLNSRGCANDPHGLASIRCLHRRAPGTVL
jgi:hypothetical protein